MGRILACSACLAEQGPPQKVAPTRGPAELDDDDDYKKVVSFGRKENGGIREKPYIFFLNRALLRLNPMINTPLEINTPAPRKTTIKFIGSTFCGPPLCLDNV